MANHKAARVKDEHYRAQLMLDGLVALQLKFPPEEQKNIIRHFLTACMSDVLHVLTKDDRLTDDFRDIAQEILRDRFELENTGHA